MDVSNTYYLLKHSDGDVFGPVSLDQLKHWASTAMVSPLDKISTDRQEWIKAPMLTHLGMDYLVRLSDDSFYGPTTLGALKEFLDADEINANTLILNACDGSTCLLSELPLPSTVPDGEQDTPPPTSIREGLQEVVEELEATITEQRRYIARLEEAYARLEEELGKKSAE